MYHRDAQIQNAHGEYLISDYLYVHERSVHEVNEYLCIRRVACENPHACGVNHDGCLHGVPMYRDVWNEYLLDDESDFFSELPVYGE